MDPARAEAYFTALMTPQLFTRAHAYVLFFSGGQGGRVSSSYELWDSMDRAFEDFTIDEAKVCSHDRIRVEGELDAARLRLARNIASQRCEAAGVLRFPVSQDSDIDEPGAPDEVLEDNSFEWSGFPTPPCMPSPSNLVLRDRLASLVRTSTDTSAASESLPLLVHPTCVEPGCERTGNLGMVKCSMCDGDLHRSCGSQLDDDDEDALPDRRCSSCATNPGK
ncbi:unnamed protein product [Pylaiella littoralis]